MREIKFRAWSTLMHGASEMISWERFREFHFGIVEDGVGLQFMQFTGLKDKNGKEIYEGDIVKADWIFTEPTHVKEIIEFVSNWWEYGEPPLEIIGNIYENPELFK